ncbi:MAG TPA: hypothetical protein VM759_05685 [Longimicrobium sp.]|nr:hypothetical protein [Longimicrobium sp.]
MMILPTHEAHDEEHRQVHPRGTGGQRHQVVRRQAGGGAHEHQCTAHVRALLHLRVHLLQRRLQPLAGELERAGARVVQGDLSHHLAQRAGDDQGDDHLPRGQRRRAQQIDLDVDDGDHRAEHGNAERGEPDCQK